jgi:four helix bundle protein
MKDQATNFPHHRLDVYRLALDMARLAKQLADRVPRGYRSFADHLLRAAGQTVLLIGEGANRYGAGQKRQRFTEARGECGETASAAELLSVLGLVPKDDAHQLMIIADRVGAMLTRLIKRHS